MVAFFIIKVYFLIYYAENSHCRAGWENHQASNCECFLLKICRKDLFKWYSYELIFRISGQCSGTQLDKKGSGQLPVATIVGRMALLYVFLFLDLLWQMEASKWTVRVMGQNMVYLFSLKWAGWVISINNIIVIIVYFGHFSNLLKISNAIAMITKTILLQ